MEPATTDALPPDPLTQTQNRMAEVASDKARELAMRKMRTTLKGYLPKVLHPLIPGERGTVEGNLKSAASKWMWGTVTSAVISLVFFAVFAVAVLGFLAVTAYAVMSSM
ncbi:MAG: hypothetical protein ABMB14_26595 [Myxococcota bacterium]